MHDSAAALRTLDEFEGYRPGDDDGSLFVRRTTSVTRDDGSVEQAWVYFFNAPLGAATTNRLGRLPEVPEGEVMSRLVVCTMLAVLVTSDMRTVMAQQSELDPQIRSGS